MGNKRHLYFLMNHIFLGFFLTVAYGALSAVIVWLVEGTPSAVKFLELFSQSFQYVIVGGLILSTSILVFYTQKWIPEVIEENFPEEDLVETDFNTQKAKYLSVARSMAFSTSFIVVGFALFYFSKFPISGIGEQAMMIFACTLYGLGVYVGRKFFYIAQMLHSIENLPVKRDIFTEDKLGSISTYVNTLSTLTVIFVFAHVYAHYNAPFVYNSVVGSTLKISMLLPAVLAIPIVVIFNFYPRTVLRLLYSRSIQWSLDKIKRGFLLSETTEHERQMYLMEFNKMSNDELKYRLRVTLSDLPIAITLVLMVVSIIT